ncbi:MAG: ABC transporter ATP-binding protein, partial [Fervidicoccaceae archaeon]
MSDDLLDFSALESAPRFIALTAATTPGLGAEILASSPRSTKELGSTSLGEEVAPSVFVAELESATKSYGRIKALNGLSLRVRAGEVLCLLGPNGSGKTTALRVLLGLVRPDSGVARIMGFNSFELPENVRRLVSYLPEDASPYERLTGRENLLLFARLYASTDQEEAEILERGVALAELGEHIDRRAGEYSKGMKRRLLLARTLMVGASLVVLDEPTSGLDVFTLVKLRRTLREYVEVRRASLVISSHAMLEVEPLCDRVALLREGRLVDEGALSELLEKYDARN